jgi:hypothetical protein
MQKRYVSEFLNLAWWLTLLVAAAAVNIWFVVAQYTACLQSFEMLNFEAKPLAEDELFGSIFRSFAPDATIAHLLAGGFEVGIAFGLWFMTHLILRIFYMIRDRFEYAQIGDSESLNIITRRIWFTAAELALVSVLMTFPISTVVDLFRYRVMAQNKGISVPLDAVRSIQAWSLEHQQNGHLFAYSFADNGVWGLLAMTMLMGLLLELIWHRTEEAAVRLCTRAEEPVSDAATDYPEVIESNQALDRDEEPQTRPRTETLDQNPAADQTPATPTHTEAIEVIGGKPGERVTVETAKARPDRFWVDPETREIWDADYREQLFGEPKAQAAGASN